VYSDAGNDDKDADDDDGNNKNYDNNLLISKAV